MPNTTTVPYAPVLIKLLQGIIHQDDAPYWNLLLDHTSAVNHYFAQIGVEVHLDTTEGYAYLHQPGPDDEDHCTALPTGSLPRLARRTPLSYRLTLLCVLLREELQRFDMSGTTEPRLILTRTELHDLLRPFFPDLSDEKRLLRDLDQVISRVTNLGFLRELRGAESHRYEVSRILKAKLPADSLAHIKEKLERHGRTTAESES